MLETTLWILITALVAFWLIELTRALGVLGPLMAKKPFSCNVCYATWMSLALTAVAFHFFGVPRGSSWFDFVVYFGPTAGTTVVLLRRYGGNHRVPTSG